jgi:hypothetical protein
VEKPEQNTSQDKADDSELASNDEGDPDPNGDTIPQDQDKLPKIFIPQDRTMPSNNDQNTNQGIPTTSQEGRKLPLVVTRTPSKTTPNQEAFIQKAGEVSESDAARAQRYKMQRDNEARKVKASIEKANARVNEVNMAARKYQEELNDEFEKAHRMQDEARKALEQQTQMAEEMKRMRQELNEVKAQSQNESRNANRRPNSKNSVRQRNENSVINSQRNRQQKFGSTSSSQEIHGIETETDNLFQPLRRMNVMSQPVSNVQPTKVQRVEGQNSGLALNTGLNYRQNSTTKPALNAQVNDSLLRANQVMPKVNQGRTSMRDIEPKEGRIISIASNQK